MVKKRDLFVFCGVRRREEQVGNEDSLSDSFFWTFERDLGLKITMFKGHSVQLVTSRMTCEIHVGWLVTFGGDEGIFAEEGFLIPKWEFGSDREIESGLGKREFEVPRLNHLTIEFGQLIATEFLE